MSDQEKKLHDAALVREYEELKNQFKEMVDLVSQGIDSLNNEVRGDREMTALLKRDVVDLKSITEKLETTLLGKTLADSLLVKIGVLESNIKDVQSSTKGQDKKIWAAVVAVIATLVTALGALIQPHFLQEKAPQAEPAYQRPYRQKQKATVPEPEKKQQEEDGGQ